MPANLIRSLGNYVRLPTKALSVTALVLASTIIVAGLALWTWSDFSDATSDGETIVSTTSLVMDDFARNSLQAADGVLESVVARIEEKGIANLGSEPEMEYLRRFARRLSKAGAIHVADDAGDIVAAVPSLLSRINVSDREWFKSLKDEKAGTHIGRRLEADKGHDHFFAVGRSIWGPDGRFIGAVQVGVGVANLAYIFHGLDRGFQSLDVRSHEKLGVYRAKDGTVLARFPIMGFHNETVATSPYFSLLAASEGESWMGWTRVGGEEHLVSARSLSGWPLIVSVSIPKRDVYSLVRTRLLWRSVTAAVTIVALSILTVVTTRQARREALLTGELEHRVNNTLAVVAAVVERTRENTQSVAEFVASLRGRIRSMARTQTLLRQSRWRGVSLANLIRAELNPYVTGSNTSVQGSDVYLTPTASHAVAMVFHELATNAAKYGALSQEGGHVSVRWTLTAEHTQAAMLRIEWNETGGPEVSLPVRQGYGSSVIGDLLPYELGGTVDLVFAASGVRCTIEMPATGETIG